MNRDQKKQRIEELAEKFMSIEEPDKKAYAIMHMTAYLEGNEAGRIEERKRGEQELAETA